MLGWEWMAHKAELFGLPIRWATYDPNAPQTQIDAVSDMLRNMGSAAWGAFPQGTDLQMIHGSTPGVAGASEPTERLMYLADRACDLIFLGQTLTSQEGSSGSYALGSVHREVELDLYENYAAYVVDVLNNQLIPAIIELNWGNSEELPFLEVELNRPGKDTQIVERDKTLFVDMGLPVSKQWLYDRHKVPAPGPDEDLFNPQIENSPPSGGGVVPPQREQGGYTTAKESCTCPKLVEGASESDASFQSRKAQAQIDFANLLQSTNLRTHDLVWTSGDCPVCNPLNGTKYPNGWTTPPPLHHNCDCEIDVRPKKSSQ
jgi:phage gp29-like protein